MKKGRILKNYELGLKKLLKESVKNWHFVILNQNEVILEIKISFNTFLFIFDHFLQNMQLCTFIVINGPPNAQIILLWSWRKLNYFYRNSRNFINNNLQEIFFAHFALKEFDATKETNPFQGVPFSHWFYVLEYR